MTEIKPVTKFTTEALEVHIYSDRAKMGAAAARAVGERMQLLLQRKQDIRMVFAAAPSQNEFLAALTAMPELDWSRVTGFQMDEYLGLPVDAPQGFGNFLRTRLFEKVGFQAVHYLDPVAPEPAAECQRYADLLRTSPIDIVCMGIGENGHLAFNDPPVADFDDPETVKIVELDEVCRQQQVNDGCFATLAHVPHRALTLTIPALLSSECAFVIVPGPSKVEAVYKTLKGKIAPSCPASIIRQHPCVTLYLDCDSAARVLSDEPIAGRNETP